MSMVLRSTPAGSAKDRAPAAVREPFPWLREALRELADIGRGVELDGPIPSVVALREARELLIFLAQRVDQAPCVTEVPTQAVGIEFYGRPRGRVMCVVKADGTTVCLNSVDGNSRYASFENWRDMMDEQGEQMLSRLGVCGRAESVSA